MAIDDGHRVGYVTVPSAMWSKAINKRESVGRVRCLSDFDFPFATFTTDGGHALQRYFDSSPLAGTNTTAGREFTEAERLLVHANR